MLRALVFVSKWCPYCEFFKLVVERLKERFPEVRFEVVDVEENPELAERYNVEMLPTTVLLNGERVVGGIMGYVDYRTAERSIRDQIRDIKSH